MDRIPLASLLPFLLVAAALLLLAAAAACLEGLARRRRGRAGEETHSGYVGQF